MHFSDESCDKFYLTTKNKSKENNYFLDFLKLCHYEEQTLDTSHMQEYLNYFKQLGNIEEYYRIGLSSLTMTTENAIQCADKLFECDSETTEFQEENIKKVISFISSHFYEFKEEDLKHLRIGILEEVLSNDDLKISDENSLFELVLKLYEDDHSYSILFSKIIFSNLSQESIEKFIRVFSIDDLDSEIWHSICERLLKETEIEKEGRYIHSLNTIEFKSELHHEFEGIIDYLTKETGGNVHDNNTIEIATNSIYEDKSSIYHPKNLVDFKVKSFYYSKNQSDIYICFDFKERGINLSSYSIKSSSNGRNSGHWRNWVIEISNDELNWEEVDRHDDDSSLNVPNKIATFEINKKLKDFVRFIRIRQTLFSWRGDFYIFFPCIEFFGKLKENPIKK